MRHVFARSRFAAAAAAFAASVVGVAARGARMGSGRDGDSALRRLARGGLVGILCGALLFTGMPAASSWAETTTPTSAASDDATTDPGSAEASDSSSDSVLSESKGGAAAHESSTAEPDGSPSAKAADPPIES